MKLLDYKKIPLLLVSAFVQFSVNTDLSCEKSIVHFNATYFQAKNRKDTLNFQQKIRICHVKS